MFVLKVFKKLQLFWFAFFLSANVLIMAAVSVGDMDYADIQASVTEVSADYLRDHPDGVPAKMARYVATKIQSRRVPQTGDARKPRPNTIEALQARRDADLG